MLRIAALGILVILVASVRAAAAELPDHPFVFVVGKADIDTPPDVARCSLTVRAREPDAGKAASTVEDRLKVVLKTLTSNKVAPADIESFRIEKEAMTDERYDGLKRPVILGYDVWRKVRFTVRQLDSIAPIEGALVRSPNVTNIDCQFDRIDRTKIEADLQTKALLSARQDAEKMATPLGRRVVAAVAVSKVQFDSIAGLFGLSDPDVMSAKLDRMFKRSVSDEPRGDDLLVPATIHLSASVNVLFKME